MPINDMRHTHSVFIKVLRIRIFIISFAKIQFFLSNSTTIWKIISNLAVENNPSIKIIWTNIIL